MLGINALVAIVTILATECDRNLWKFEKALETIHEDSLIEALAVAKSSIKCLSSEELPRILADLERRVMSHGNSGAIVGLTRLYSKVLKSGDLSSFDRISIALGYAQLLKVEGIKLQKGKGNRTAARPLYTAALKQLNAADITFKDALVNQATVPDKKWAHFQVVLLDRRSTIFKLLGRLVEAAEIHVEMHKKGVSINCGDDLFMEHVDTVVQAGSRVLLEDLANRLHQVCNDADGEPPPGDKMFIRYMEGLWSVIRLKAIVSALSGNLKVAAEGYRKARALQAKAFTAEQRALVSDKKRAEAAVTSGLASLAYLALGGKEMWYEELAVQHLLSSIGSFGSVSLADIVIEKGPICKDKQDGWFTATREASIAAAHIASPPSVVSLSLVQYYSVDRLASIATLSDQYDTTVAAFQAQVLLGNVPAVVDDPAVLEWRAMGLQEDGGKSGWADVEYLLRSFGDINFTASVCILYV